MFAIWSMLKFQTFFFLPLLIKELLFKRNLEQSSVFKAEKRAALTETRAGSWCHSHLCPTPQVSFKAIKLQ